MGVGHCAVALELADDLPAIMRQQAARGPDDFGNIVVIHADCSYTRGTGGAH